MSCWLFEEFPFLLCLEKMLFVVLDISTIKWILLTCQQTKSVKVSSVNFPWKEKKIKIIKH